MTLTPTNKRILISGFEPFDGDAVNPSALLLEWLKLQVFDFSIHTELLPVSFLKAYPKLLKAIETFHPTHVILTGLAKNRTDLTIERIAINWVDARIPDNDGVTLLNQKILADQEDGLFCTLPILKMMESAKKVGCPTRISTTAGEYVCNHLFYTFLSQHRRLPGTFIHLPGAPDHSLFFEGIKAMMFDLDC